MAAPRILIAAGLEPSGRAGLLADFETVRALNGAPLGVCTALTAQGTKTFAREAVSARVIAAQLSALKELGGIDAVKLGMVADRRQLAVLVRALEGVPIWVIDPVVMSSKGERLSSLRPRDFLALGAKGRVLTPNVAELAWLSGGEGDLRTQARRVLAHGFSAVVVKGGHARGETVRDLVVTDSRTSEVVLPRRKRLAGQRGTGCRHASALVVKLALGATIHVAARRAQSVVWAYLASSRLR